MKVVLAALAMAGVALVFFLQQQRGDGCARRTQSCGSSWGKRRRRAQTGRLSRLPPRSRRSCSSSERSCCGCAERSRACERGAAERGSCAPLPTPRAPVRPSRRPARSGARAFPVCRHRQRGQRRELRHRRLAHLARLPHFPAGDAEWGENAEEGKLITITMCLLKVPEGDLPESLLRKLQSQASAESPVLTGTEAAFLMNQLDSGEGTNVISRPRIAIRTVSGRACLLANSGQTPTAPSARSARGLTCPPRSARTASPSDWP